MTPRPLSLAHLSLIDHSPEQLIRTAGEAGFDLVDLRLAPATPMDRVYNADALAALCRALKPILCDTGLRIWDVEIIRLNDQTRAEDYLPLMETAAELGARRIKLVCDSADHAWIAAIISQLCDLAAPFGLMLDLEYMIFSGVKSLGAAVALAKTCARPNLRVLVDALHWVRAGDALKTADPAWLGYVQLCDGPLQGPRIAMILSTKRAARDWRRARVNSRWMIFWRRCHPAVSPVSKCPCHRAVSRWCMPGICCKRHVPSSQITNR